MQAKRYRESIRKHDRQGKGLLDRKGDDGSEAQQCADSSDTIARGSIGGRGGGRCTSGARRGSGIGPGGLSGNSTASAAGPCAGAGGTGRGL